MELGTSSEFLKYFNKKSYDFFDFGCSKGDSLRYGVNVLDGKCGLGIDIDRKKIEEARSRGFDAILFDICKLPEKKLVKFTLLNHLLEHIFDHKLVRKIIAKACVVSHDFVLIKKPYFDADGYLMKHGVKTFYSDWSGHPNMMTSLAILQILRDIKLTGLLDNFSIHSKQRIFDSNDSAIHPLSSPIDQHEYDPRIHSAKKYIRFDQPVYYEVVALLKINQNFDGTLLTKIGVDDNLYSGYRPENT